MQSIYQFNIWILLQTSVPPPLHQVLECGEEKGLSLTEVERVKALAAQLVKLLRSQRNCSLPVGLLLAEYGRTFGYSLRLQDYDAASLPALLAKLCHVVKVTGPTQGLGAPSEVEVDPPSSWAGSGAGAGKRCWMSETRSTDTPPAIDKWKHSNKRCFILHCKRL